MPQSIVITDKHGVPMQSRRSAEAYRGASRRGATFANWNPGRYSGHSAARFSRESLNDRIHDLARNDGWTSAALQEKLVNTIGSGFSLASEPNTETLGISFEEGEAVADQIEALWLDVKNDPGFWMDAERMFSIDGVTAKAANHFFADGEAFGWIGMREESPTFQTCVQVIDPMRISNPNGQMDSDTLRDGVELDEYGAAIAYHIRQSHPGDLFTRGSNPFKWERFDRETEWGRPVILHLRSPQWAGMSRAIADIAATVGKNKQLQTYDETEINAATLNAALAAYVSTPVDPELMEDSNGLTKYAESELNYYGQQPLEIEGVQLGFLHPGSSIQTVKAEHPNMNHEAFTRTALRNIGAALGVPYDILTGDAGNYSTMRGNLMRFFKRIAVAQGYIARHWQGQIFRAWLEEVFDLGLIKLPKGAPSFEAAPIAWSQARWIGPGAGWIDPEKEVKAAQIRLETGIGTLENETAMQGGDWKRNVKQRARERRFQLAEGIDPDAGKSAAKSQSPDIEVRESSDERDAREDAEIAALQQKNTIRTSGVPRIRLTR